MGWGGVGGVGVVETFPVMVAMAVVSRIGMMAFWLLLPVNEAFGLAVDRGLRVESKQETMARMTTDVAVKTVLGLNRRQAIERRHGAV